MQNNSQNLLALIDDLKADFEKKKGHLESSKLGESAKIEAQIRALEAYQVEIEGFYSTNENMFLNFRKRVAEIKFEISHL